MVVVFPPDSLERQALYGRAFFSARWKAAQDQWILMTAGTDGTLCTVSPKGPRLDRDSHGL